MARLFDSYVMVDWSAASKPATGADSIWIGALTPDSRLKLAFKASNPPTRAKALEELADLLGRCLKRGDRVLLGMDFPMGFPTGTAAALKLKGEPWRATRDPRGPWATYKIAPTRRISMTPLHPSKVPPSEGFSGFWVLVVLVTFWGLGTAFGSFA